MKYDYPFTNSIVFALVMRDPSLCKGLLQTIFPERPIREVRMHRDFVKSGYQKSSFEELELSNADRDRVPSDAAWNREPSDAGQVTIEKSIIVGIESRKVRLDVLFTDSDAWYDIEMQVRDERDIPKRSRYAHAVIDVDTLRPGQEYNELKPSYVIFLCCFDCFGEDMPVYQFLMREAKTGRPLGDETYTVVLNSRASLCEMVDEPLWDLFRYMNEAVVSEENELIRRIDRSVDRWNSGEGRRVIMTLEREIQIKEMRAKRQGLEQGREEREKQMRALYLAMKRDGRRDEYDEVMESDDSSCLDRLLVEYGLASDEIREQ